MGVIAFNSFDLLPAQLVAGINTLDTFLLTMAMTALGTETSIDKFRKAGAKPFVLAFLLLYLAGSRRLFPGEVSHSLFNVIKKRTYVDSQNDILQNLCKSVFWWWYFDKYLSSCYKGIFPCFLGGFVCILFSVISNA